MLLRSYYMYGYYNSYVVNIKCVLSVYIYVCGKLELLNLREEPG